MNLDYIKANKEEVITLKKKAVKFSDGVTSFVSKESVNKEVLKGSNDSGLVNKNFVANTYNWMDSHDDVHVGNTFKKSISENKNIFHLHDHEFKLTSKVGQIKTIEEKEVSWRDLGVDKDGATTVLMVNSDIKKSYNELIYNEYLTNKINQHSVGMQYVKIELAINDEDSKEEYAVWNKYIDLIGNKDKAIEKGYFWAVKEARLSEVSAVLMGSNELTDIYEPSEDTQKTEDTQEEPSIYKLISQNFKLS